MENGAQPGKRAPVPPERPTRSARIPDHDTPERTLSDLGQRLQLALERLPGERRAVLLRLEQDLTLEQIAAITGAGRETVRSRLRHAMDRLRAQLPE